MASRASGLNDRAGDRSTGTQQLLDDGRFQGDVVRVVQACDGVDPRAIVDARVAFVGRRAGAVLHERANGGIAWPFRIEVLPSSVSAIWLALRAYTGAVVGLPTAVETARRWRRSRRGRPSRSRPGRKKIAHFALR